MLLARQPPRTRSADSGDRLATSRSLRDASQFLMIRDRSRLRRTIWIGECLLQMNRFGDGKGNPGPVVWNDWSWSHTVKELTLCWMGKL
jgi:hypothetical protein